MRPGHKYAFIAAMKLKTGFTLIELLIVMAIIAILVAVAALRFGDSVRSSGDAVTKGNLGALRSALSVYYSDNNGIYPTDNLTSMTHGGKYLETIPKAQAGPVHLENYNVTSEVSPSETGGWSYNNDDTSLQWGKIHVGCFHSDNRGNVWSTY